MMMCSSPKKIRLSFEDTPDQVPIKRDFHKTLRIIDELQAQMGFMSEKLNLDICKMERLIETEKKPLYDRREEAISQIPSFWFTSLVNHPMLSKLLQDQEEEIFSYMTKMEICLDDEDAMTYSWKMTFFFKENPYFKNTTLIKEYVFKVTGLTYSKNVKVSSVMWKEGNDISHQFKDRKSLFCWLTSTEFIGNDLEVAQAIKDDLWINPLPFYLLTDNQPEDNRFFCSIVISSDENGESDDNDVIIIEDSDDEKSIIADLDDDDSDNTTDELGSVESNEAIQIENN